MSKSFEARVAKALEQQRNAGMNEAAVLAARLDEASSELVRMSKDLESCFSLIRSAISGAAADELRERAAEIKSLHQWLESLPKEPAAATEGAAEAKSSEVISQG